MRRVNWYMRSIRHRGFFYLKGLCQVFYKLTYCSQWPHTRGTLSQFTEGKTEAQEIKSLAQSSQVIKWPRRELDPDLSHPWTVFWTMCYMHVSVLPSVSKTTYADTHHDAIISIRAVTLVSQAAITKYHGRGAFNKRSFFSHVLEARSLRWRFQPVLFLGRAVFLAYRQTPFCCVFVGRESEQWCCFL